MYTVFFLIFDVILSIAKGIQHDGRLPFWKPSVFAYYVCIVIAFAFGGINILLLRRRRPYSVLITMHTRCNRFYRCIDVCLIMS